MNSADRAIHVVGHTPKVRTMKVSPHRVHRRKYGKGRTSDVTPCSPGPLAREPRLSVE